MPRPNRTATRCSKCGSVEHTTSQCSLEHRVCFQCREPGHESKACPQRHLDRTCGGCGQKGHTSQGCPDHESWICKNCAQSGHGHWECTKQKGYRRKRCQLCHSLGHTAPNCENRPKPKPENATKNPSRTKGTKGLKQERTCTVCGEDGHMRWECFQMPCSVCGKSGHEPLFCFEKFNKRTTPSPDRVKPEEVPKTPTPSDKGPIETPAAPSPLPPSAPRCHKCGSHQHDSRSCSIFQEETNRQASFSANRREEPRYANPKTDHPKPTKPKHRERPYVDKHTHLKAQGLWKAAEYELAKDNYDRALTSLAEAVALEPHEPEYYITRAFTHMKLHEYAAALRDFDLASTKPTYTPRSDCLLPIARCRLLLGSPSSALLAVKDALSINGADGDALSLRRRILELEGHMAAYRGAVSRDHWRMARSAYESCLSVYAQEHSDAPGQVSCWGVELLIAEGKLEDAMKSVDVLLRDVPNDVDAMTLRGLALFLIAKPSEALTQLAAVLKLDPDNGTAKALRYRVKEVVRLKGSGSDAFQRNEYQTAIASWASALGVLGERDSEGRGGILRSILLLDRATALCKIREFADGLKDVNESLQLCPADYKAFLCRARIMVGLELFETAAEDFRAALEHGKASSNGTDKRGIEAELEEAEQRAKVEGSKQQDHYATIGLTRSCSAVDIKKAYRALSLKHHPDKGGVAEKFRQIARAYEILSDPDQKRTYDAKLQNQSPGPSTQSAQRSWWEDYFRKGPDLRTV